MEENLKQLLLKDLSARLPYKPIVHAKWSYTEPDGSRKYNEADRELRINDFYDIWHVKPYLRPMSSITEEEKMKFNHIASLQRDYLGDGNFYTHYQIIDWFNKNHIDYRGLIEKGLALEAPEGMYK